MFLGFGYGLGGFSVVCGYFGGVSNDPKRIHHMPICWNLAGNQMGQNYDGHLFSSSSQRQKIK